VRILAGGAVRTGRAVDLGGVDVESGAVLDAIRSQGANEPGVVEVDCPAPGPVHEHVGLIAPGRTVRVRSALAAVARERGLDAPQDTELADLRTERDAMDPPEPAVAAARRRLGAVDEAALSERREEVAARRGAVQARLELDADVEPAREALSDAVAELADAQTDRVAAEQTLDRARERARESRARRRERLRLEDRVGNLERAAREHLAGELRDEFAAAVATVPGDGAVPGAPSSFTGGDVTAALAVARLADLRAPVVLAADRFETATRAADCLAAPVVRL
jgi:hypothetical protein